jgi:hypothetical protein
MARRDHDALGNRSLVLVFIAGNVQEPSAPRLRSHAPGSTTALAEDFTQGVLSSPRAGVGFYVIEGQASFARHELAKAELQSGVIDGNT